MDGYCSGSRCLALRGFGCVEVLSGSSAMEWVIHCKVIYPSVEGVGKTLVTARQLCIWNELSFL